MFITTMATAHQWVDTSVPGGKGSYLNEGEAKGMFLSSTEDDTAAGAITFEGLNHPPKLVYRQV